MGVSKRINTFVAFKYYYVNIYFNSFYCVLLFYFLCFYNAFSNVHFLKVLYKCVLSVKTSQKTCDFLWLNSAPSSTPPLTLSSHHLSLSLSCQSPTGCCSKCLSVRFVQCLQSIQPLWSITNSFKWHSTRSLPSLNTLSIRLCTQPD